MKRLILIALLVTTGIVAFEPFGLVMPSSTQMIAAGLMFGLLVFSIGLLWQEKPADEREEVIYDKRGKLAYYAGLVVGCIGLTSEVFLHSVNWWLVVVVGSMLLVKLFPKK
jgi:hypothetical protein